MSDDLEKAIIQAYDPLASQQARSSALTYLSQVSESAGGWRNFVEKLFATADEQIALVCLTAVGDIILHRYAFLYSIGYPFHSKPPQMVPFFSIKS